MNPMIYVLLTLTILALCLADQSARRTTLPVERHGLAKVALEEIATGDTYLRCLEGLVAAYGVLSLSEKKLHGPNGFVCCDSILVFQTALGKNFAEASVNIVDCPDLTAPPFRLAAKGLCGSPKIADVGGQSYLTPTPQLDHKYNLQDIATLTNCTDGCFILGAGAGPYQDIGSNCELMTNAYINPDGNAHIGSHVAKINQDGKCLISTLTTLNMALLGNFYLSQGQSGKVLEVKAKNRTGTTNFVTVLRRALRKRYAGQAVGVGGIFLVEKGKIKMHVMPDFSTTPLTSEEAINKWLKFFEFSAPMIFESVFVSEDPGLDLRLEHSHGHGLLDNTGKSAGNKGGHYHYDTTPHEMEYRGYYNIAQNVYRIDRPTKK